MSMTDARPGKPAAVFAVVALLALLAVSFMPAMAQTPTTAIKPAVQPATTAVSSSTVAISNDVAGRLTWLAPEGSLVEEGDIIAVVENSALNKAVEFAEATVLDLEMQVAALRAIEDQSLIADKLAAAESAFAKAHEAHEALLNQLDSSDIRAPYAGRIIAHLAKVGDHNAAGSPLVQIEDADDMQSRSVSLAHQTGLSEKPKTRA